MNHDSADKAKVIIVSASDSFLAKSLIGKLESTGVEASFANADIKEIEEASEGAGLFVLFMSEDLFEVPEVLVYMKDTAADRDLGLILIGEQYQYDQVIKVVPEKAITEHFKRPLDIDRLVKKIQTYLEENTGEKRKKTILIVDDDITYMRTVYEWLKESYHVGMASNGVQAISYLAKTQADLILLDYEMPIANGPQVLSMLKNDSDTGHIPVMFLTGHGDRESVLSVVGLSPADYLLKTIDRQTLLQKLEDFFRKRD